MIKSINDVEVNDTIQVLVNDGEIEATVQRTRKEE
jgi:exonuclease VII large subunit